MVRDDRGCLPSGGTLRRSGGLFRNPVPGSPRGLRRRDDPRMTFSHHPGPAPIRDHFTKAPLDEQRRFARDVQRRFTADENSALGLCSLVPPPFLGRSARAYSRPDDAYRLLQQLRRAGTATRALESSQGRRPQPPSFSDAFRVLPCRSGERTASRALVHSSRPRCRFLPLARVCPTAMPRRARHLRRLAPPQ